MVFEIDKDQDTGDLKIQWLSDPPDDFDKTFLKGHLVRLEKMRDFVHKEASKLTSAHERFTTLEFYEAMITALDYATSFQEDEGDDANDDLSATKDEVGFNMHVIEYLSRQSYERIDYMESQYNEIAFEHSDSMQDTCLYLNEHLQACSSFRPHYHEVFVHYPARYVDEVKRVAFIGGGDNFILHEILRYPSLELVVGLELDHEVVRSSFRNLGSQPHFDNEKVEWWFGDGSKSIRMLPKEYYGTFDLVLLDLQTEVVDILKVGEKHNIMDAAFMLLKPDGVMARNEDWHFGTNKPFAKYMVDLFYVDVPIIAHQGITLGSETVDFMTHPQKDHKIDTLYLEAVDESKPFKRWYNYRKTESDLSQFCKEGEIETVSGAGVLMVVEAQDAAVKSNSPDLRAKITEAIKNAGLSETSVVTVPQDEEGQSALVFALQEGYLTMRLWKDVPTYFGFELMLWDSFDKLNSVRSALLQAIESKSSSYYRMVYNDVYGSNKGTSGYSGYGPESNTCDEQFPNTPAITATGNVDQTAINSILAEIVASSEGEGNKIMVGCGEETQPCGSLDELKKAQNTQVMPVFACPGMATGNMTQEKSQSILECESSISAKLLNYATEIGAANAVYIDAGMPEAMAKAIRKVLSNKNLRRKILTKDHVALTAMLGPLEPWRRALIDRFRTEFAVFDPAFQTDILFKNAEDSLLSLGIFSSGDYDFFYHLSSTVASIEKTTNLAASIQHVKNGINNYVPDFKPSLVTSHEDYDSTEALKQWKSQQPLARQAIMQFQDKSENPSATSSAQIKDAFAETLTSVDEKYHLEEFKTPGHEECSILVAYWKDCTAVLLWNGRSVATLNLFTYDDDASLFEGLFTNKLASVSKGFVRTSQDLLPRGHGHVVNFAEDIGDEDELPHWA